MDLRPAEVGATGCHPEQHSMQHSSPPIEQPNSPLGSAVDKIVDCDTSTQEVGPPRLSALPAHQGPATHTRAQDGQWQAGEGAKQTEPLDWT